MRGGEGGKETTSLSFVLGVFLDSAVGSGGIVEYLWLTLKDIDDLSLHLSLKACRLILWDFGLIL
jgi:hypothetical protein